MNEKIRVPIIWFSFFMALMLFQVSYMNIGTITALGTLAISIITAFAHKSVDYRKLDMPMESILLLLFFIITTGVSLIRGEFPSFFGRFSAQILLCIVFLAFRPKLNQKESNYLYNVFVISALIYALLTIISCIQLGSLRYYHARIEILGAKLDPNFIGLPFVIASTLFLSKVFIEKRKIFWIIGYSVCAAAIVFTASRGNMVSLLIANAGVVIYSIFQRRSSVHRKVFFIILVLLMGYFSIHYFSTNLSLQWTRITSFEDASGNGRLILWENAIEAWKSSPLLGQGLGGMYRLHGKATHNTYLELLSETGLVGMLLFLSFLIRMLRRVFHCNKVLFCALIGMLVHIAFLDSIDNRCVWILLCWIALMPDVKLDRISN